MKVLRFIFLLSFMTFIADLSLDAMKRDGDDLPGHQAKKQKQEEKEGKQAAPSNKLALYLDFSKPLPPEENVEPDLKEINRKSLFKLLNGREIGNRFSKTRLPIVAYSILNARDTRDKNGNSPLHLAVQAGSLPLVRAYAEIFPYLCNTENHESKKPLACAREAKEPNAAICQFLQARHNLVYKKDQKRETTLFRAAREGNYKKVKWLIEHDAACCDENTDEKTPLDIATDESVKKLLQVNSDLHKALWDSQSPIKKIQKVLDSGADVNAFYAGGDVSHPLLIASYCGNLPAVKLLLDRGAFIHVRDSEGNTPLHYAAKYGKVAVVQLLLARGADKNIKNDEGDGLTPLMLAQAAGEGGDGKELTDEVKAELITLLQDKEEDEEENADSGSRLI